MTRCRRDAISHAFRLSPIAANLDSRLLAFIFCDFWLQTETHRTKDENEFRRANSEDLIWFVAPANEQLAAITDYRFHGISFHFLSARGLPDNYSRHWIR